ncbi:maleylpyruvate isomerase N-terminal domain-containing protein [Kribbella sp. GL6]|uniref:maleylpyruvate isomerase N-terminal domain-containing protein n=1 Tax=Kribbella sp. GL6 TaxID=3419765 RepID=UPI003D0098D2
MPDQLDHLTEFERAAADFAAALGWVDPTAAVPACPGWTVADLTLHLGSGQPWAASILRRRLHETVIHLVDLVQAGAAAGEQVDPGLARPLAAVAADGVDEVFGVFLPRLRARGFAPAVTRQVGVRATDTGHEWTLTPVSEGNPPTVERGKAVGEAVLSGTAADLDLCLWKRLPPTVLTVDGDPAVGRDFLSGKATA